jgi:type II secretory pathway pseudopilin PulG
MRVGSTPRAQNGFVLVGVLAALFLLAIGTQRVMATASEASRREKEERLLRVGAAYAAAIRSYYLSSPGSTKRFPRTLDELIEDRRFVNVRRHLREPYADPITGGSEWGLVAAPDGGIAGVYSRSPGEPLRSTPVAVGALRLTAAARYSDWRFAPALVEP